MVFRTIAWSLAIGISVLTLVPPGLSLAKADRGRELMLSSI